MLEDEMLPWILLLVVTLWSVWRNRRQTSSPPANGSFLPETKWRPVERRDLTAKNDALNDVVWRKPKGEDIARQGELFDDARHS